jgi:hypothetical protein
MAAVAAKAARITVARMRFIGILSRKPAAFGRGGDF